ncbi:MAG: cadmium-translocating P-type ATPase, partial [Spirochaetaceae bacterium]|nr:cadmium-translocating P-type ATPase [Spirochaetaceae bacterium]
PLSCECSSCSGENEKNVKKNKTSLFNKKNRIIYSFILFVVGLILTYATTFIYSNYIFYVSFIIIGWDVVFGAIKHILKGKFLDERFLMSIAALGAFGVNQTAEGVAVMLFYQIGEAFNEFAMNRSKKSIEKLMELKPQIAHQLVNNKTIDIKPEDVNIDDIIIIRAGERVPLDAIVIEGESTLDVSALTGESIPLDVSEKSQILSGAVNQAGILKARVEKPFGESTFSRILQLIENASSKKATSELFIRKFAHYYTPIVVLGAVLTAIIPPLLFAQEFSVWFYRALMFLVVSCPCALVLSVPLAFFGGIGAASKKGVLIKGGAFIEKLAKVNTIVFDKTGTLTKGQFSIIGIDTYNYDEDKALSIAAKAESATSHPIGQSIVNEYCRRNNITELSEDNNLQINEVFGKGISAIIDNQKVFVGNNKFLNDNGIEIISNKNIKATLIQIAIENKHVATIAIADTLKKNTVTSLVAIRKEGVKHLIMLSGDRNEIAQAIAKEAGIDDARAQLLPQDKVNILEEIMKTSKVTAFVGDGINDAPSIARSDIGIAMGALGSDAAIEASDVVIMGEELSSLPTLIKISKKTLRIAKENIIFAISIKVLIMILAVVGIGTMWIAVFGDVGVSILAILNSLRLL